MRSLYEHSDASDLTVDLLELIETDLLRMHPGLRKKCDQVVQQLGRLFDNSCRNRNYCLKLTRDPPVRKDSDLSRLDPVEMHRQPHSGGLRSDDKLPQFRPRRGSGSSSQRPSSFRHSNPHVATLFEEPVSVDYMMQKGITNGQLQQPIESQTKLDSNSHIHDIINTTTPNDNSETTETIVETVAPRTTEQEDHGQPEQMGDEAGPSINLQNHPLSSDVQSEQKQKRSKRRGRVNSGFSWAFCCCI
jgi:hypothetical protein